jgi:hypothetical protein
LDKRVRPDHPLREIREIANTALAELTRDFTAFYSAVRRPTVPPEKLQRAMPSQTFYSLRSESQLMERIAFADFRGNKRTNATHRSMNRSRPRL